MNLCNLRPTRAQHGFTLTELMIAIALGMSVISSVLLGYLATYSGSVGTLANSKLNQEMTTLMNVMIEDIRRAGYAGVLLDPSTNLFNNVGTTNTALAVFNNLGIVPAASTGSGNCIVYAYDRNDSGGAVETAELFGFRRNVDVVEMRRSGNPANAATCNGNSTTDWMPVTDTGFMDVTDLTFNLASSACLNAGEPDNENDGGGGATDDVLEFNCYGIAPDPTNITVETREILITLTANLADDPFVSMTKAQRVRVRNDLVRITP